MSKVTKTICLIAAGMVAFGVVITGVGYILGGNPGHNGPWGFWIGNDYSDEQHFSSPEMKHISEDLEDFQSIDLDMVYQIIEFREGDGFHLESIYNSKFTQVSFDVTNGVLTVNEKNHKPIDNWLFQGNQIERMKGKLIITYPKGTQWKDIEIDAALGDLELSGMTLQTLNVTADMGAIEISGIQAQEINVNASMGDIDIEDSSCDTSDIDCDMGTIDADNFVVRKSLNADAAMGDINVSGNFTGTADVNCDMGSVYVGLAGSRSQYSVDASVDMGSVDIDGDSDDGWGEHLTTGNGPNTLNITNSMGDIEVEFDNH